MILPNLLAAIVWLIMLGFVLWLVNRYVPMAEPIRTIVNAVVVLAVLIWLFRIAFYGNWP